VILFLFTLPASCHSYCHHLFLYVSWIYFLSLAAVLAIGLRLYILDRCLSFGVAWFLFTFTSCTLWFTFCRCCRYTLSSVLLAVMPIPISPLLFSLALFLWLCISFAVCHVRRYPLSLLLHLMNSFLFLVAVIMALGLPYGSVVLSYLLWNVGMIRTAVTSSLFTLSFRCRCSCCRCILGLVECPFP